MANLHVAIVEHVANNFASAVREVRLTDKQQIHGHRRIHSRRRLHGTSLPGVQYETLLAKAGSFMEEDVSTWRRFVTCAYVVQRYRDMY